ncbi:alpha-N-arabinofuranosidase [Leifsonia aquatica]|uniref:arabinosylfuranosidase ArfA n=1 Tax=Leifsonia aquatica TaxID=144185 RepID=UPI00046ADA91|nr:alpha-N-arabinofuranosidase [Leifsonia aquatica]
MPDANIVVSPNNVIAPVNRRLFGSFVEHLGRCVYGGIYEPTHPTANEDGFRMDVVDLVKELGASTFRYPGGNFVSGYRWEDGVGPRESRPRRRDLAWHSLETNQVGVDEFVRWAALSNSEVMMAVNLGTRGIEAALDLLEYCNDAGGTSLSDQRAANGSTQPHNIRMWCLGNEMDGPWQVGHMSAEDYGSLASRTAAAMKMADPDLELVLCGSSASSMPTFGEWERVSLEQAYDYVDYISCHAYYQERGGDLATFLASSLDMQHFITTVVTTADHVKHKLRKTKTINLSFDEWNIWYLDAEAEASADRARTDGPWPYAPRLLEDVYTVADAVVLGSLLITLLKNIDRVGSASLAQLVNVIAPIMTAPDGPAWKQTTFHPFSTTARLADGKVVSPEITVGTYDTAAYGSVPLVDAVATFNEETARAAIFLVNRHLTDALTVTIDVHELAAAKIVEALTLADDDVYATNTQDHPTRVTPSTNANVLLSDGVVTITLPPVSWTAVSLDGQRRG